MTLAETLIEVWRQAMKESAQTVVVSGKRCRVGATSRKGLRTVDFTYGKHRITGIEQNPEKTSRWAQMARRGRRIMQFRCGGRYIGNVAEGRLTVYGAWKSLSLPE